MHVERRALPSSLKKLNREFSRRLNRKGIAVLTSVGFLAYSRWAAMIAASENIGFIPNKLFKWSMRRGFRLWGPGVSRLSPLYTVYMLYGSGLATAEAEVKDYLLGHHNPLLVCSRTLWDYLKKLSDLDTIYCCLSFITCRIIASSVFEIADVFMTTYQFQASTSLISLRFALTRAMQP